MKSRTMWWKVWLVPAIAMSIAGAAPAAAPAVADSKATAGYHELALGFRTAGIKVRVHYASETNMWGVSDFVLPTGEFRYPSPLTDTPDSGSFVGDRIYKFARSNFQPAHLNLEISHPAEPERRIFARIDISSGIKLTDPIHLSMSETSGDKSSYQVILGNPWSWGVKTSEKDQRSGDYVEIAIRDMRGVPVEQVPAAPEVEATRLTGAVSDRAVTRFDIAPAPGTGFSRSAGLPDEVSGSPYEIQTNSGAGWARLGYALPSGNPKAKRPTSTSEWESITPGGTVIYLDASQYPAGTTVRVGYNGKYSAGIRMDALPLPEESSVPVSEVRINTTTTPDMPTSLPANGIIQEPLSVELLGMTDFDVIDPSLLNYVWFTDYEGTLVTGLHDTTGITISTRWGPYQNSVGAAHVPSPSSAYGVFYATTTRSVYSILSAHIELDTQTESSRPASIIGTNPIAMTSGNPRTGLALACGQQNVACKANDPRKTEPAYFITQTGPDKTPRWGAVTRYNAAAVYYDLPRLNGEPLPTPTFPFTVNSGRGTLTLSPPAPTLFTNSRVVTEYGTLIKIPTLWVE